MSAFPRTIAIRQALRRIFRKEPHFEPLEMKGLVGRCHTSWPVEASFRAAWDDLLVCCPWATTFQSAIWQRDGIGPTLQPGRLRLLTVSREQRLLAVVPMQLTRGGFLETTGYAVSDYLDPLVDLWNEEDSWRMILRLILQQWDRRMRGVTFHNMRPGLRCQVVLPALATEAGFVCEWERVGTVARLKLPATWEAYLDLLDPHERKELRRKMRKAQSQADARLHIIDNGNFDPESLMRAMDLMESTDQSKRQWLGWHVRPLLMRVGRQLIVEGGMRLLFLLFGQTPAACLIELSSRRGPLLYNGGFDAAWREYSPGIVTFGLAIQEAIERGAEVFDLLRGQEGYKYRLGATDEPLYRLVLRR
jgi:CelD/BcsL family acetyltransferase involved in cellulose biosynthesis